MSRFIVLSALALFIAVPAVNAQMIPETSTLIVDQPVDIGGTVLQPGTYMIQSHGETRDRSVVRVTSPDGTKTYATALTVSHHMEAKDSMPATEFVYYPAGEGQPRALRTWYPSDPVRKYDAYDIVYSESRAKQLARLAKGPVVSYRDQVQVADYNTTELQQVTPDEQVQVWTPPTPVITETETRTTTTQIADAGPMELPRTASNIPMIALLGVVALGAAAAVRVAR
jgi:hypothetical protein